MEELELYGDKSRILPIYIQNYFLKFCREKNIDETFSLKDGLRSVLNGMGLQQVPEEAGQTCLFSTPLVLMNITYLSIYLIENDAKINMFYEELKSKYEGKNKYEKMKNQKILIDNDYKLSLFELMKKIRNSFAHNNYKLYMNGMIELYNQKFETKKIPYEPSMTVKELKKTMKEYKDYEIQKIGENDIVLKNYKKHIEDYSFKLIVPIELIQSLTGQMAQIIMEYIKELDIQGV